MNIFKKIRKLVTTPKEKRQIRTKKRKGKAPTTCQYKDCEGRLHFTNTFRCAYCHKYHCEKHLPTDIPPFVGWLAIRNGKIKELKKPIQMPQRNMDFVSLEAIQRTLKASNLPHSWDKYTREFIKVGSQLQRTLLLNYWFDESSWCKDKNRTKTKPFENSIMLKTYLSKLDHTLQNAYDEAQNDYGIQSGLSREISCLKEDFDKITKKLEDVTINLKKHREIKWEN